MKKGQVLIDIESYMSSVLLIEDGRLNEFYVEYLGTNLITGNIYKGRVVNVLQGLQTAFVDIGLSKNGFLYVGETLENRSDLRRSGLIPSQLNLKEGDYVMVQVTKEETETKGARLSINPSIPGRFSVFMPSIDFVGVSNKITEPETREKLTKMFERFRDKNEGFIARTICTHCTKKEILGEAQELRELYKIIKKRYDASEDIALIHSEGNLLFRTVRDMLRPDVDSIICNDLKTCNALKERFKEKKSRFYNLTNYFESEYDMLDIFGVSGEIDKLLDRKVELASGATLIIDKTEALTAIDVNTARFKGRKDHEQTVFEANLEAAKEIARQIRLRNIGGIIIVDFIDMVDEEHKKAVVEALRQEAFCDRIKTRVLDMTELGLVEITRKKVGYDISSFLLDTCNVCKGSSRTHSADYVSRKIKASLKRLFTDNDYSSALIHIDPQVIDEILSKGFFRTDCETLWRDKTIYLIPSDNIKNSEFQIVGSNSQLLSLPAGSKLLY